jgi:hypothetical protein
MSNLFSYQNNYYNNVISLFGSFNYSNKVIDTIKGIHKVLKPGGQFMIMVYGKNYQNRKTYILKKLKIKSPAEYYNSKELLRLFNICDYSDVKVSGMTFISEYLQNKLSTTHISKLFHLENKYLSKFLLNQFFFLIITGKKYA